MRIAAKTAKTLYNVLWSHMAATGLNMNGIQAKYPDLFEAYMDLEAHRPAFRYFKRDAGRPVGGKIQFSRAQLNEIDDEENVFGISAKLGVSRESVTHWIVVEGLFAMQRGSEKNSQYIVPRDYLINFLRETGRA